MKMMNDTVARIVDLMFENTEMNEEVAALRDEVMNNCQERYSDLTSSGMREDDAVAAVVESLKGMEDVIAQYRRKSRRAAEHHAAEYAPPAGEDDTETGERHLIFASAEIHRIDLSLVSEDVTLEASHDADYHVIWNVDDDPCVHAESQNGILKIERLPGEYGRDGHRVKKIRIDARDGMKDTHVYMDGEEVCNDQAEKTLENVSTMLENLGRSLGRMFSSLRTGFGGSGGVIIRIPEHAVPHVKLLTTSGDIDVQHVALAELNAISTSGDIDVELDEDQYLQVVDLRTTSGDIEATVFADEMSAGSTSGDVEVEGRIRELTVNTISGDIDVRADVVNVRFKAVSGDVELEFDSDELRDVQGSTISGDIDIDLPMGVGAIAISTSTRSGDVTTRYATNDVGPTVTGSISSLSGDITIC